MCDLLEGWSGKVEGMGANIFGPALDVPLERGLIACVKGAGSFLIPWKIARHHRHEPVGRRLGGEDAFAFRVTFARFVHEATQDGRSAAGLRFQPLPVAGEEGDFSGDDTEFGAPPSSGLLRRMGTGDDVVQLTAKVQVNRAACTIIKDEERNVRVKVGGFDLLNDGVQRSGGETPGAGEGGIDLIHPGILPR